MADLTLLRTFALAGLLGASGCAIISEDQSAEALKANAETHVSFQIAVQPGAACAKAARRLMWCAGGPNFHYYCNTSPDGNRAELSGTLEAVYRSEFFMVTEFVRSGNDSMVTVHQHDGVLVYDYAPLIEEAFSGAGRCHPR